MSAIKRSILTDANTETDPVFSPTDAGGHLEQRGHIGGLQRIGYHHCVRRVLSASEPEAVQK